MKKEIGTVVEVTDDKLFVEFLPNESCEICPSKSSCGTFGKGKRISMKNSISTQKGDIIEFEIHEMGSVISAAIVYGIPIVFLIIGMWIGYLSPIFSSLDNETRIACGGAVGIFFSLIIIKISNKYFEKNRIFHVRAIRVIKHLQKNEKIL